MELRPANLDERNCGHAGDDYRRPVDVVAECCAKVKNTRSAVVGIVVMMVLVIVRLGAVFGVVM